MLGKSGWQQREDARRILERDHYRCYVCEGRATEVDHLVPLCVTGPEGDIDSNKAAICGPCHKRKTKEQRPRERRPRERHPGLL